MRSPLSFVFSFAFLPSPYYNPRRKPTQKKSENNSERNEHGRERGVRGRRSRRGRGAGGRRGGSAGGQGRRRDNLPRRREGRAGHGHLGDAGAQTPAHHRPALPAGTGNPSALHGGTRG